MYDQNLKYVKINSINPLYLIINKQNGYFEEINKKKYLALVLTNETKENNKKYEEQWSKLRDLIRSITKNSDEYDEKFMTIKFNSDNELPLNKTIEIPSKIIVVRAVSHKNSKYYPQFFLYKLLIIQKFYIIIELTILKELMLIKQVLQKNVMFVTIGIS